MLSRACLGLISLLFPPHSLHQSNWTCLSSSMLSFVSFWKDFFGGVCLFLPLLTSWLLPRWWVRVWALEPDSRFPVLTSLPCCTISNKSLSHFVLCSCLLRKYTGNKSKHCLVWLWHLNKFVFAKLQQCLVPGSHKPLLVVPTLPPLPPPGDLVILHFLTLLTVLSTLSCCLYLQVGDSASPQQARGEAFTSRYSAWHVRRPH